MYSFAQHGCALPTSRLRRVCVVQEDPFALPPDEEDEAVTWPVHPHALRSLDISDCALTKNGAERVVQVVADNTVNGRGALIHLDLSDNPLGPDFFAVGAARARQMIAEAEERKANAAAATAAAAAPAVTFADGSRPGSKGGSRPISRPSTGVSGGRADGMNYIGSRPQSREEPKRPLSSGTARMAVVVAVVAEARKGNLDFTEDIRNRSEREADPPPAVDKHAYVAEEEDDAAAAAAAAAASDVPDPLAGARQAMHADLANMGNDVLEHLSRCELLDLRLNRTGLQSRGAQPLLHHLATSPPGSTLARLLKALYLSGNGICDSAATPLQVLLADNTVLEMVDISFNKFSAEAAALFSDSTKYVRSNDDDRRKLVPLTVVAVGNDCDPYAVALPARGRSKNMFSFGFNWKAATTSTASSAHRRAGLFKEPTTVREYRHFRKTHGEIVAPHRRPEMASSADALLSDEDSEDGMEFVPGVARTHTSARKKYGVEYLRETPAPRLTNVS